MIDRKKHRFILVNILKEIYADPLLGSSLGFKGGTAAFLFYDLPRLSVDLDFDLLDLQKEEAVFQKLKEVLKNFGQLREARKKRYTLFFLLNYQKGERNIKVEVSKRKTSAGYQVRQYLGIPVLVMDKSDMAASKLAAFLTRKKFAARDLFDLWFFLKNDWAINEKLLQEKTGLNLREALEKAKERVEKTPQTRLLQGLGELLDDKQKIAVKDKLKEDLLLQINLLLVE